MTDVLARLNAALSDRYRVERELGSGGMAVVYLAHDNKLNRQVALKVLRPELASSIGAERFLREIEIASKLNHPHILPLLDCGSTEQPSHAPPLGRSAGSLYYTMPYIEGESLRDRLNREKQLSLEDALQITREVADALGYAHSLGVVHRDIKPENILFQAGHAVVSDFGIDWAERWSDADTLFAALIAEAPDNVDYRGFRGVALAHLGRRDEALETARWLEQLDRPYLRGAHTWWRAAIAAALGDREDAVRLLQQAYHEGMRLGHDYQREPEWRPLRDYRPYQEFVKPNT